MGILQLTPAQIETMDDAQKGDFINWLLREDEIEVGSQIDDNIRQYLSQIAARKQPRFGWDEG